MDDNPKTIGIIWGVFAGIVCLALFLFFVNVVEIFFWTRPDVMGRFEKANSDVMTYASIVPIINTDDYSGRVSQRNLKIFHFRDSKRHRNSWGQQEFSYAAVVSAGAIKPMGWSKSKWLTSNSDTRSNSWRFPAILNADGYSGAVLHIPYTTQSNRRLMLRLHDVQLAFIYEALDDGRGGSYKSGRRYKDIGPFGQSVMAIVGRIL